jgi:putative transposase
MTQLLSQVARETPGGARAVQRLSAALGVARATYYRRRRKTAVVPAGPVLVRQALHEIALEMPTYGHRPMTAELRRRGLLVGRDRVRRYMREEDLLCRPRRAFVVTTDSPP